MGGGAVRKKQLVSNSRSLLTSFWQIKGGKACEPTKSGRRKWEEDSRGRQHVPSTELGAHIPRVGMLSGVYCKIKRKPQGKQLNSDTGDLV